MRIGVLTGGGDCPGLNAVIRAIVRRAERHYGDEVIGFIDGWKGVLDGQSIPLTIDRMRGSLPRGGTVIGTSRTDVFRERDGMARIRLTLSELEIDALIVIGGEGTLACAARVGDEGIPLVGVPKTIDNDIEGTQFTFGFQTAVQIATDAIDRLHTTAESHDRVMLVEVMGRSVGWIAVYAGIAGGATVTLIPEVPFDIDDLCQRIVRRHELGRLASLIVIAEGAQPAPGTIELPPQQFDQFGRPRLGGIANFLAPIVEERTGYETRVTILGHVQRGGTPNAQDRVLSTRFGLGAIDAVHDGDWNQMVALQAGRIVRVPMADVAGKVKQVPGYLYDEAANFFA